MYVLIFVLRRLINVLLFRELYGVPICKQDLIQTLKNITKHAIESEVCKLPCIANYLDLENLDGITSIVIYSLNSQVVFLINTNSK